MFDTFEECRDHILQHITNPTPCREMIIDVCEWLYSSNRSAKSNLNISSYPVNEPGVRFFSAFPGEDHFFCIKYRKKRAELHFYRFKSPGRPILPSYMSLVSDNENWTRINATNVTKLPIETIKDHVKEAYRHRFQAFFPE